MIKCQPTWYSCTPRTLLAMFTSCCWNRTALVCARTPTEIKHQAATSVRTQLGINPFIPVDGLNLRQSTDYIARLESQCPHFNAFFKREVWVAARRNFRKDNRSDGELATGNWKFNRSTVSMARNCYSTSSLQGDRLTFTALSVADQSQHGYHASHFLSTPACRIQTYVTSMAY